MFTIFQLLHDLSLTESVLWRQGAEHRYAACNLANGPIQAGVLYLGAPQVWPDAGGETAGFLLLNVPQPPKQLPKGCEAVGLATDEPPAGLFARLQAAAVARLQQDLDRAGWLTRALQARTPAQLMKQAAMMLQNPVILTTASYRVLAMEDGGLSFSDPVWEEAKQTGYCGAESVRLFENENITRQVLQSPGPLVLETGLAAQIPRILSKVEAGGRVCAYFGVFQVGRAFTPWDLERTAWVIRTLETMIELSHLATWDEEAIGDSLIVDLLQGRLQQATLLNDRMRAAGWRPQRNFRCAVLLPDSPEKGIANADYLLHLLRRTLPLCRAVRYQNGLVVLLNFAQEGGLEPYDGLLRQLADEYDLFVGISSEFRRLIRLPLYCGTAREAVRLSRRVAPQRRVTYFCDVMPFAMASRIEPEARTAFEQTKYKILADHNRRHGTGLCQTLQAYIQCGCSTVQAAEKLFLHRNTLSHRLDKIVEISGIDLKNGEELTHFLFSCRLAQWDALCRDEKEE